jgi:hypothetical protein
MSEQTAEPVRLSPAELRTLFLFEKLDDDQLKWLSEHGYCQTWRPVSRSIPKVTRRPVSTSCSPAPCPCTVAWRTPK